LGLTGESNRRMEKISWLNISWFVLTKYYSGDKIRRMRWAGFVARTGGEKSCIRGFGREFEVYVPRLKPG